MFHAIGTLEISIFVIIIFSESLAPCVIECNLPNRNIFSKSEGKLSKTQKVKEISLKNDGEYNFLPKISPDTKAAAKNENKLLIVGFFPNELIGEIVIHTKQKLDPFRPCYHRPRDCLPTDFE